MLKKTVLIVMALLMMIFVLAACQPDQPAAPEKPSDSAVSQAPSASATEAPAQSLESAATSKTIKIGISINATSNIHNQVIFEETQKAAKAAGHDVVATNANGMATQQATDIENLIQQKCNVIIIQNGDRDGLKNVVQEAKAANIPMISYESGWIDGVSSMFAMNDFSVAAALYPMIAGEMGFEGEIITINHNDHPAIRARRNVQDAVLREYTNIKNVNTVTSGFPGTVELAYKGVESALQANPKVKAIWATFDLEAIGALQACQALGRSDIMIVGVDGEEDVLKNIAEGGQIVATVVGDQTWGCAESVKVAEKLAAGEKVKALYDVPFEIITKENIDKYYKK
jgi:ABC-type sugar transport system substrate-binding protein